ncbi:MAG TPA: Wzy polymerase domain-containing protein [Rhodocyclaceae bacterium]|nr:Wzy polymerase domain-containing protein [Rhodocyclaceae bacterium]
MFRSLASNHIVVGIVLFLVPLIPQLLSIHHYPQTVFFNEWAAALVLVGLGLSLFTRHEALALRSSKFPLLLFLIAMFAWAQRMLGLPVAGSVLTGQLCYLLTFLAAYALGNVVASTLRAWAVSIMAAGLMVGALFQCLISVAQLKGWDLGGLVMVKLLNSVYGNIAQPNHFGDLLWLGMMSGLYLWLQGRLSSWFALVFATVFCFFSALSASRAVLLYTVAVPILALVYWRKSDREERSRIGYAVAILAAISIVAQVWVSVGGAGKLLGVASSLGRLNDAGSNTQRLFDWSVALRTSLQHPLLGSGAGTFAWQTALHSIGLPPASVVRIGENAHNTILNFAAEFGLLFTAALLVFIALWMRRRLREQPTLENFWALGILAVIGAHSMVEYPLWYTYFLVPFGFAIGVIDARDETLPVVTFSRAWLIPPLVAGAAILAWTYRDYERLEEGYRIVNSEDKLSSEDVARIERLAKGVNHYSIFSTHAGILRLRAWQSASNTSREMATLCDSAARVKPSYAVLTQCITAYAMQGRKADSDLMVDVICGAYPPSSRWEFSNIVRSAYAQRKWAMPVRAECL